MADLKQTNKNLEKNAADKKKKASAEKQKLETDLDETKAKHEKEVGDLKDKIRQQKTSTDAASAEQVSQIEKELNQDWQEKLDRQLASADDKHKRSMKDVLDDKATLEAKIKDFETKFEQMKSSRSSTDKQVLELQGQVDELKVWKDKYDTLRTQATGMKERYDERVAEMEAEREKLVEECNKAVDRARQQSAAAGGGGAPDHRNLVAEVKKIMNSVFHKLKAEIDASKSYKGQDVHGVIMETIKNVTLQMTKEHEEDESEEESEEESEGEEEEDGEKEELEEHEPVEPQKPITKPNLVVQQQNVISIDSEVPDLLSDKKNEVVIESRGDDTDDASTCAEQAVMSEEKGERAEAVAATPQVEAGQKQHKSVMEDVMGCFYENFGQPSTTSEGSHDASNQQGTESDSKAVGDEKAGEIHISEYSSAQEDKKSVTSDEKDNTQPPAPSTNDEGDEEDASNNPVLKDVMSCFHENFGNPRQMSDDAKPQETEDQVEGEKNENSNNSAEARESQLDAMITMTGTPSTGGHGNPYYAAEIGGKDKSEVIQPHVIPSTGGGGGNPFYAAEIQGKTLKDEPAKKPSTGSDFLSSLESSIIPEGGTVAGGSTKPASSGGGMSFLDQLESSIETGSEDKTKPKEKVSSQPDVLSSIESCIMPEPTPSKDAKPEKKDSKTTDPSKDAKKTEEKKDNKKAEEKVSPAKASASSEKVTATTKKDEKPAPAAAHTSKKENKNAATPAAAKDTPKKEDKKAAVPAKPSSDAKKM